MKRPMIPEADGTWTTPEQLLAEIARMDRGRPRGRKPSALILAILAGLAAAGALLASTWTLCYAVTAGGRPLAYVREEETCAQAVAAVEARVSGILHTDYAYPETPRTALTLAPRQEVEDREALTESLMDTVDQVKAEYVLTVDGAPVAVCADRADIDAALQQAEAAYASPDTVEAWVSSDVEVSLDYIPAGAQVLDAGALARRLTGPAPEDADGLPVYAPEEEVWEESGSQPLLEVTTVEEVTRDRPLPAPVEEREDPSLLPGETRVLQPGAEGLERVTERITRSCGVEEARETLSAVTVTEPVAQVVAVGTGSGQSAAAGRFQWPCQGRVTSPFGARHIFGSDSFHRGTDIAAPLGTEIRAAAAGTVCFAGEKGSYGSLIQVDHGNGYVTCYAHCSQLLAAEGDLVEQGQTVALVGSTGRSTGPHCHFEIRWQGEPFDPESCLP